jgi:hypothetical protein
MNEKERHEKMHHKMMQHWRNTYGSGSTFPFPSNSLMIELGMKEFFAEGYVQGFAEAIKQRMESSQDEKQN